MKVVLSIVGGILLMDALVAALMLALWAARGHMPDFVAFTVVGIVSVMAIAMKLVGGSLAAVGLWQLRQGGRLLAGIVAATNALHTLLAAADAGALARDAVWGTVALNALVLLVVALPASARACQPRLAATRPGVDVGPRTTVGGDEMSRRTMR